jgi:hypothetical protein
MISFIFIYETLIINLELFGFIELYTFIENTFLHFKIIFIKVFS